MNRKPYATAAFTLGTLAVTLNVYVNDLNNKDLTFTADAPGEGGQMNERIAEMAAELDVSDPDLDLLLSAWKAFHFTKLAELPEGTVDDLKAACERLNGRRLGAMSQDDLSDLPDLEGEDVIDGRDLSERLEGIKSYLAGAGVDLDDLDSGYDDDDTDRNDLIDEVKMLQEVADQCDSAIDNAETFVRDSYFKEYAQQYAEDIGAVNSDATWPNNCIDWDKAASDLQQDYSSVEIYRYKYWVRN